MSSSNRDSLLFSFQYRCPFLGLISLVRTSNTTLNKRLQSRYPCLVPDLREGDCLLFLYIVPGRVLNIFGVMRSLGDLIQVWCQFQENYKHE